MNFCESDHAAHETKVVSVRFAPFLFGRMAVYDAEIYRDTTGYCPGDDAVSRSLIAEGQWERWNSEALIERDVFQGNLVIDAGSHIGWYSVLAATRGCNVVVYEGDYENAALVRKNAALNNVSDKIVVNEEWIDEDWSPVSEYRQIDLIKSDVEGNDQYVVNGFWDLIEDGLVSNLLVEISPVFKPGYPEMVERLMSVGYRAEVTGPEFFDVPSLDWVAECGQCDILFTLEGGN